MTDPTSDKNPLPRFGDRSEEVRKLQGHLNRLGYRVAQDSAYGRDTQDAVRHLQAGARIRTDGVAAPQTLAAVDAHMRAGYHAPADWRDHVEHQDPSHEAGPAAPADDGSIEVSASVDVALDGIAGHADDEAAAHTDDYGHDGAGHDTGYGYDDGVHDTGTEYDDGALAADNHDDGADD